MEAIFVYYVFQRGISCQQPTESVDKEEWGPGTHWVNINVHRRKIVSFTCHRSYTSCAVLIQGRSATVIPMALYGAKVPWLNSKF